ncbi:MAG: alpha/beta hydrolase [Comamonadaceae bacterium]|nr:MAG: alpha/beta hydrolase [Comamonadaceae bacterium]
MSTHPASVPVPPAASEIDTTIPVPGRAPLQARIYGRKRRGAVSPLVLHFHGGAFVSGDLESGVYLAGDEAGGNLAAAVALLARDRAHPPLAGQILVAPMLDPCVGTASLRQAMECNTGCKWADGWQQYLRGPMDAEHPYAVPAHATRLVDLPPALVLTGLDDPMRDEALVYAQRLRDAGIAVTSEILPSATGWPDSLADAPGGECPCAAGVQRHLRAFLYPATPPPPH